MYIKYENRYIAKNKEQQLKLSTTIGKNNNDIILFSRQQLKLNFFVAKLIEVQFSMNDFKGK